MKKVTLDLNGTIYELGGGLGAWAKSRENGVKRGTVRMIGGVLLYAWAIHQRGWFGPHEVYWAPAERDFNSVENLRKFVAQEFL